MSMSGHVNGDDVLEEMTKDDESLTGFPSAPGSIKEDQDFELQRVDSKDDSRDADVSSGEEMDKQTARIGIRISTTYLESALARKTSLARQACQGWQVFGKASKFFSDRFFSIENFFQLIFYVNYPCI